MKRFLIKLSYTVFPLWLVVVGLVVYYNLAVVPYMQGDSGALGKIPTKEFYERDSDATIKETLVIKVRKADSLRCEKADVLVCGDSFSGQGLYGYPNYMAHKGISVVNYSPVGVVNMNPFQSAFDLLNLGYVDSSNAKTIIIESVERSLLKRILGLDIHNTELWEDTLSRKKPEERWSITETSNYISIRLGREKPVIKLEMSKPMFSGTHGRDLYVYHADFGKYSIPDSVAGKIRDNIDALFSKAAAKGMQLIILICPDKYDVYQNFVVNNPYPAKTINEDFRRIVGERSDIQIGKELLSPFIERGDKDMYYLDDTHWSYKTARIVADSLCVLIRE